MSCSALRVASLSLRWKLQGSGFQALTVAMDSKSFLCVAVAASSGPTG
jgi:hypothetical protein